MKTGLNRVNSEQVVQSRCFRGQVEAMPLLQLLSKDGVDDLMLLQHGLAPALVQHKALCEAT